MPDRNKHPHPQPLSQGQERGKEKWLTVCYLPVSLFSLKRSDATSMAARSNLVPTPYCIKMALLKILIEGQGSLHADDFEGWIEQEFTWIRGLEIRVQPPEKLIVNRNGYKLRYYDQIADKADKNRLTLPLQGGFVFREWVHLQGYLMICCQSNEHTSELSALFAQINYFGKRGCFFQFLPDEIQETDTPTIERDPNNSFVMQPMDDLGTKTTFSKINPYSNEKMKLGSDRIIKPGMLPLQLIASSARYDLYERR